MKLFAILLSILLSNCLYAQGSSNDSIVVKPSDAAVDTIRILKRNNSEMYAKNGKLLNFRDIESLLKSNSEASKMLLLAKQNNNLSNTLIGVSAALVVVNIIAYVADEHSAIKQTNSTYIIHEHSFIPLFAGIGLLVVSIPVAIKAKSQLRESVSLYNKGQKAHAIANVPMHLKLGSQGLSLCVNF